MAFFTDSAGLPTADSNGNAFYDSAGDLAGVLLDSVGLPILDGNGLPIFDNSGDLPALAFASTPLAEASVSVVEAVPLTFADRLRAVLPAGWFADASPVLDALLLGCGAIWGAIYDQIVFTRAQTRIATATGVHLNMASLDYLGGTITRRLGEADINFSGRIRAEIIRPRVTRAAVSQVLNDLTGHAPRIIEPALATDTGGIGHLGMTAGTGLGIGVAGAVGSLQMPFQFLVTARRGGGGGIAGVMGIYTGSGPAYGGIGSLAYPGQAGAIEIGSLSLASGQVTDADIYDAVTRVIPAAGMAWTAITN